MAVGDVHTQDWGLVEIEVGEVSCGLAQTDLSFEFHWYKQVD